MGVGTGTIIAGIIAAGATTGSAAIAARSQKKAAEANAKATESGIAASERGTELQTQAAREALDFEKQKYGSDSAFERQQYTEGSNFARQQYAENSNFDRERYNDSQTLAAAKRKALSPYAGYGASAIGALGSGLGLTPTAIPETTIAPAGMVSGGQVATPPPVAMPQDAGQAGNVPAQGIGSLAQIGATQTQSGVKLASPDGSEQKIVPSNQVDYWISKGARRIV